MENKTLTDALRCHALEKTQLEFALKFRAILQQLLADARSVKLGADSIFNGMCPSLREWEKKDPRSYEQYIEFQRLCTQVLHSLVPPDFRLFPVWMDRRPLMCLLQLWGDFAPFTATSLHKQRDTNEIESAIIATIESIDHLFPSQLNEVA